LSHAITVDPNHLHLIQSSIPSCSKLFIVGEYFFAETFESFVKLLNHNLGPLFESAG